MKMLRASRVGLVLMIGLSVLCTAAAEIATNEGSYWLVSPELLRHANLKVVWQNQLPVEKTETLKRLIVLGDYTYALSDKNFLMCWHRQQGNRIFGRSIAPAGFTVLPPMLYQDELVTVIANRLVELDATSGTERQASPLEFRIVCPAARNSSYFYLAGTDRRLHALHADNKVQAFEVAAQNDSMITSVIADEGFVIFGTDAGNVVSVAPDKPYRLWQFDATAALAGPVVRDGMSLFFASEDTHVYRLDMVDLSRTKLVWRRQMPGVLGKEPRVTQGVAYQYAHGKGLTAIDRDSGEYLWSLQEGTDLLAEAGGKAYVITNKKTLVVMDNSRARKLYTVNFAHVARHVANTIDSKIYVADERGRIACLEPIE